MSGRRKRWKRCRKIPINGRYNREERDALTRSKGREGGKEENVGKKSRRRMNYRGASKDGTYGSKNRNQSHWLKAAWPEKRENIWRAELPGSSMSTCLPLPSPDSRLSFSLFLISLSPLLYVSSSPSFFYFSFSRRFVHLLQGKGARRAHALVVLLPLSLARAPNQYAVESRFTQIRPRTFSSSYGEAVR